jgi:hypothetical protein
LVLAIMWFRSNLLTDSTLLFLGFTGRLDLGRNDINGSIPTEIGLMGTLHEFIFVRIVFVFPLHSNTQPF